MPETAVPLLAATGIEAGYPRRPVLHGVSVALYPGEVLLVAGHNGSGKSTLVKAIFGLLPLWGGHISFRGEDVKEPRPQTWLRQGVSYAPQGNRIFPNLTVLENLRMGGTVLEPEAARDGVDRALDFIPDLRLCLDRRAATLSGGMKQMVALGTAMVIQPKVMLLDEPLLGLAAPVAKHLLAQLEKLKSTGMSLLIVEHRIKPLRTVIDRAVILREGAIAAECNALDLADDSCTNNYLSQIF